MTVRIDPALADDLSRAQSPSEKVDALFAFMHSRGGSFYDESVTQLEHALQAAQLARGQQATAEQITAALLHDIGHFLMDEHDEHSDFLAEDWCHEAVGAEVLERFFDAAVTEPVRLHVPAKRYLCSVDASYFNGLSRTSQQSFRLQGGEMTPAERVEFESHPFHKTAVLLRRWDDGAKVKDQPTTPLEDFHAEVESCVKTG